MIDKKTQSEVAIAALMHDIGKFKQRAFNGDETELKIDKEVFSSLRAGEKSALWTYDFFVNDFSDMMEKSGNQFLLSIELEKIAKLAASHNTPSNSLENIIAKADNHSVGLDRDSSQRHKEELRIETPLCSLLSTIDTGKERQNSKCSYELGKLSSSCSLIMPQKDVVLSSRKYRELFDGFKTDLEASLKSITGYVQLIRKLKDLLLEYTWCIPVATNDFYCDISLYDHSITTMSIALALLCNPDNDDSFRICAFGISGIQSFIFQSKYASFKYAAKIFRGRSFLVAFFSTAFEEYLCYKLGLIPFFDVMDAGGNITLLLPNMDGLESKLEDVQREIEIFLLEKYHATLSIVMDYCLIKTIEDFGIGKYKNLRIEIGKLLNRQKSQKFKFALQNNSYVLDVAMGKNVCSACGKHNTSSEGDDALCSLCEGQRQIGQNIPLKKLLVLSTGSGDYEILPNYFISLTNKFTNNENGKSAISGIWTLDRTYVTYPVWRINNYTSDETFEEIATNAVGFDNKGKKFLAYIKIDVDSLGNIINKGMNEREYSVSRFSTLSRTLHNFFNGYVYSVLEMEYIHSYTVLSGGDDLFLIMPWNSALSFVSRLRDDFEKFVAHNEKIHFSVGVVLAKEKEPFALVNERANIALEEAKIYPKGKDKKEKNAISYLGATFSLKELDRFIGEYHCFKEFVYTKDNPQGPLTTGFVYRLYQYVLDLLSDSSNLARKYGVYSKLHYDVARNIKSNNENANICADAIKFIMGKFNNYKSVNELEQFKLILIQTLYEMRTTYIEEE